MSKEILIEKIEVFTEKEAAKYIRMSRSFLRHDRANGYRHGRTRGPEFVKIGRTIRYCKKDLDEWLLQNRSSRHLP